jgi:hypothetical protein
MDQFIEEVCTLMIQSLFNNATRRDKAFMMWNFWGNTDCNHSSISTPHPCLLLSVHQPTWTLASASTPVPAPGPGPLYSNSTEILIGQAHGSGIMEWNSQVITTWQLCLWEGKGRRTVLRALRNILRVSPLIKMEPVSQVTTTINFIFMIPVQTHRLSNQIQTCWTAIFHSSR